MSENEMMLAISTVLSSAKNESDLLDCFKFMEDFFQIKDIFLSSRNPGSMYYELKLNKGKLRLHHKHPAENFIIDLSVLENANPDHTGSKKILATIDIQAWDKASDKPDYITLWSAAGYRFMSAIAMGNEIPCPVILWIGGESQIITDLLNKTSFQHVLNVLELSVSNIWAAREASQRLNDQHIIATEEIKRRETEKNYLLSISEFMSRIRDKNDLLDVINTHLKNVVNFTHSAILLLSADKLTISAFLLDPQSPGRVHPEYYKLRDLTQPVDDGIYNVALAADEPVAFDVEKIFQQGKSIPVHIKILHELRIRWTVLMPLSNDREKFGLFIFFSHKPSPFKTSELTIIKSVSNQISIAVSNILANDAIRKRELEKEILISLSHNIARTRNKSDLITVINSQLKKLFYFSYSTVGLINDDKETFCFFLTDPDSKAKAHPDYHAISHANHSINNPYLNQVFATDEPCVFILKEAFENGYLPAYIIPAYETGNKELLTIRLTGDHGIIGTINFISDRDNSFSPLLSEIIKGIASQIAIAIANIVANEKITEREKDNETLLAIGYELGNIRDSKSLLAFINTRLKKLFSFDYCSIAIIDEARRAFSIRMTDPDAFLINYPELKEIVETEYVYMPGAIDIYLYSEEPVVVTIEPHSNPPGIVPVYTALYKAGIREAVTVSLSGVPNNFHHLAFLSTTPDHFTPAMLKLIKGISSQISIAFSNISANEEVIEREAEKALLLDFSNEISLIKDNEELTYFIKQHLHNKFKVSDYVISIVSDDKESHSFFMVDYPGHILNSEIFKSASRLKFAIDFGMSGITHHSEHPVVFNSEDLIRENLVPVETIPLLQLMGFKEILGIRLMASNELVGYLWTRPYQINDYLLKGLSAQIATAIANLNSNRKIRQQLSEINQYKLQLEQENQYLQDEIGVNYNFHEIIGSGPEMQKVFQLVSHVSKSSSTVLLLGETGTGKELIARAIHSNSGRKDKLMIKLNCAALPATLIESELFGHEKGSFTGATERRLGKFELANGSTLFLDEIGEMPLDLQVKLLRVLQEKEIERLGGKTTINVDVRIIAATNRNLKEEVNNGHFRSDLYYRLNVFPVVLPALRERSNDIPVLASYFLKRYAKNNGKKITSISNKVINELKNYHWPGNVRELEHVIERSVLLTTGNSIRETHLPAMEPAAPGKTKDDGYVKTIDENERDHILYALKKCNGKVSGAGGAAELLKIPYSTLTSKIRKLGIKKAHYFPEG